MAERAATLRRWLLDLVAVVSAVLCVTVATLQVRGGVTGVSGWARPGGTLYLVQSQPGRIVIGESWPWPCGEYRWNSRDFPVGSGDDPDYGPGEDPSPWRSHFPGLATLSGDGLVAVDPDGRVPWTFDGRGGTVRPAVPIRSRTVAVSSWLLLALLSPLPAARLIALVGRLRANRRRRLRDRTHCRACGYDLTGNTSGVCPECGTPAAAAADVPPRG